MECEGVVIDEAIWDIGVGLVWLDHAEPCSGFVIEPGLVIEEEGRFDDGVPVIDSGIIEPVICLFVGLPPDREDEFDDWMIEVELHPDL